MCGCGPPSDDLRKGGIPIRRVLASILDQLPKQVTELHRENKMTWQPIFPDSINSLQSALQNQGLVNKNNADADLAFKIGATFNKQQQVVTPGVPVLVFLHDLSAGAGALDVGTADGVLLRVAVQKLQIFDPATGNALAPVSKLWPSAQADLSILLTAMVTPNDPFQDPAIFGRPRRTELGRGRFQPARAPDVIMPADAAPVTLLNQSWMCASAYGSVFAHLHAEPDALNPQRMAFRGFPPLGRLSYTIEISKLAGLKTYAYAFLAEVHHEVWLWNT